jgi:hypothetical protein
MFSCLNNGVDGVYELLYFPRLDAAFRLPRSCNTIPYSVAATNGCR